MLERVKRVRNLMVLNDEAHLVHDEDLAWHKTLMGLHQIQTELAAIGYFLSAISSSCFARMICPSSPACLPFLP